MMELHNYCVLETDDQLTIVNRSTEHRISKKLLHKIPYFESMLSHDVLESKENKVELDFDEKTFKIILDWIELDFMYIDMDHVINLCTMADYFGMNDDLLKDCFNYFHKKFSFEFLPTIIPQVTSTSKLVNSSVLNAFICRHFLKIVQTARWLYTNSKTIDYICKLDLMIYSEYQVFDAIMKWVNFSPDSRKSHLKALLNSVRWCHMEYTRLTKVKENELIKSEGLEPLFCSLDNAKCVRCCNRTKQEYFIAIEELEGTDLRIKVLDSNFLPLVNQVVQLDASMPLHVLHDEHISDIPFDSGRRLIRLDWKQNKYRLLDYKAYVSHHFEVARCTCKIYVETEYQGTKNYNSSLQRIYGSSLLEANGKFILFRIVDGPVSCWSDPKTEDINPKLFGYENNFISTIFDKNIYIMTKNLDFMTFKIDQGELKIIPLEKIADRLNFDDLILTSSQVKNEVFLVDKSTKNIFSFCFFLKEWVLMGLLVNYNSKKTGGQKALSKLLTFTTAFLSIDAIRPCLKRKLASMN